MKKPKRKVAPKKKSAARKTNGEDSMSTKAFNAALDELGLTSASKATAKALGVGVRHVQRIANGHAVVPPPIRRLLWMYLKHPRALSELGPELLNEASAD